MSTIVITGASGDIGINYIRHLDDIEQGTRIIAVGNSSISRLSSIEMKNCELIPVQCDLSDNKASEEVFTDIADNNKDINRFISFAFGKLKYDRASAFSAYDIEKNFRIQVSSCGIALSKIIPVMKKNRFGRVIITTSSASIGTPPAFMSEYTIVKYAALGMIRSYAAECIKYGITVNGIAPSMVNTRMWDGLPSMLSEMNLREHPLKRSVTFDEINNCIDNLTSEKSGFITGENINLSGGETI